MEGSDSLLGWEKYPGDAGWLVEGNEGMIMGVRGRGVNGSIRDLNPVFHLTGLERVGRVRMTLDGNAHAPLAPPPAQNQSPRCSQAVHPQQSQNTPIYIPTRTYSSGRS